MNNETAKEIEIAIARYFGIRQNAIVPNVSWGLGFPYECDLLILRDSGFAIEIEIKISPVKAVRSVADGPV